MNLPQHTYPAYGTIYLALPVRDADHLIYKLCNVVREGTMKYRWLALWNTATYMAPFKISGTRTGSRNLPDHKTIEAAIEWAEGKQTHRVVVIGFNELVGKRQLDRMFRVAGIDRSNPRR